MRLSFCGGAVGLRPSDTDPADLFAGLRPVLATSAMPRTNVAARLPGAHTVLAHGSGAPLRPAGCEAIHLMQDESGDRAAQIVIIVDD